jgi:hypothetical protein
MCPGINTIGRELGLRGAQQQCAHNTYEISTLHTEPGLRDYPREVGLKEGVNKAAPVSAQPPHAPGYAGLQSNRDSALAMPPASSADARTGTPAYCKHAVGSQLDCRDGTSDGRRNRDASGSEA